MKTFLNFYKDESTIFLLTKQDRSKAPVIWKSYFEINRYALITHNDWSSTLIFQLKMLFPCPDLSGEHSCSQRCTNEHAAMMQLTPRGCEVQSFTADPLLSSLSAHYLVCSIPPTRIEKSSLLLIVQLMPNEAFGFEKSLSRLKVLSATWLIVYSYFISETFSTFTHSALTVWTTQQSWATLF